jgi:hypothetical protein
MVVNVYFVSVEWLVSDDRSVLDSVYSLLGVDDDSANQKLE